MRSYQTFAFSVAKQAGALLLKEYGKVQTLEWKLLTNYKIEVDDKSDQLIRKRIQESYPEHNIDSEEGSAVNNNSKYTWSCDPLDGTIPYTLRLNNLWSTSIGLIEEDTPIIGAINAPLRQERYTARIGEGAFCNGQPIHVSSEKNVNHVVMSLDAGKETDEFQRAQIADCYQKFYIPKGITCSITSGAAAVPLSLVASGQLHACLALSWEPWDMAGAVPIIREAGGRVTNLKGEEWSYGDSSILAANPKLHSKLLDIYHSQ